MVRDTERHSTSESGSTFAFIWRYELVTPGEQAKRYIPKTNLLEISYTSLNHVYTYVITLNTALLEHLH